MHLVCTLLIGLPGRLPRQTSKIPLRELPEIPDFCRLSWSNVSWASGGQYRLPPYARPVPTLENSKDIVSHKFLTCSCHARIQCVLANHSKVRGQHLVNLSLVTRPKYPPPPPPRDRCSNTPVALCFLWYRRLSLLQTPLLPWRP